MNIALWIVAGVLAAVLLVAGINKLAMPKEKLLTFPGSGWVEDFSPRALKAIATLEILGAVGLIMPAVLDIAPVLVPLAATGAALLFTGAVITRLRRGEKATPFGDLAYFAMAVFVAWGRFGPYSFHG
jgi:DoxX-like family